MRITLKRTLTPMRPSNFAFLLISLFFSLWTWLAQAEEPLPPEKAFRFSASVVDAKTLEARWQIADGYYLYKDKLKFSVVAPAQLGSPSLPAGKMKQDETFGTVETYREEVVVKLPLAMAATGELTLQVSSQGCWDGGICYPPLAQEVKLSVPAVSPTDAGGNESDRVAALFKNKSLPLILLSFFGFGLLLSFTPCMFPMIPILSGIIVNHGHAVSHRRAFVLSLAYVLGMALTYAVAGVAAGLSGTLLSAALQNVWVLGAFALIFVLLALSMFGFYELQLPNALQSRISANANKQGGSLAAIALMGALSALIVGPCVAAPLAGALLYIAKTGDGGLGGLALFVMAIGMGLPLLLVGAFSRSLLPKSGPWMDGVNRFFGVVMLATALWLLSPVLPAWLNLLGWALLLIIPAIYLHALDPLPVHAPGWQRLAKSLGVVMLIAGTAMLLGMLAGAKDPLQPLGFMRSQASASEITVSPAPTFERVASVAELDARLSAAAASGKPVLLDFYADWCVSCKEMERFTFSDAGVATQMKKFTLLQADVTANSAADKALLNRFDLFGPPGIIFFDAKGKELKDLRVVGFQSVAQFHPILSSALR